MPELPKPVGSKDPYVPLLNIHVDWQGQAAIVRSGGELRVGVENKGIAPAPQAFVELLSWSRSHFPRTVGDVTRPEISIGNTPIYKQLPTVYPGATVQCTLPWGGWGIGEGPWLWRTSLGMIAVCYDMLLDPRPQIAIPVPEQPADHTKISSYAYFTLTALIPGPFLSRVGAGGTDAGDS